MHLRRIFSLIVFPATVAAALAGIEAWAQVPAPLVALDLLRASELHGDHRRAYAGFLGQPLPESPGA
jgi:hypothetical protein